MILEKMAEFFEARLDGYDDHMLRNIAGAHEFYPFTAQLLPMMPDAKVLDLGCGTGLELGYYFVLNPAASVTGIDLSYKMLANLKDKFPAQDLTLICGSYFDILLEENTYDAVVSVESLHHFTVAQKLPLYQKVFHTLTEKGYFILTDYFSLSDMEEADHFADLALLKAENGISDQEFYHYDTPLTVSHETQVLLEAGFSKVEILRSWGATYTLKATK